MRRLILTLSILSVLSVGACKMPNFTSDKTSQDDFYGYYKVGKPYEIDGRWYYPKEQPNYDERGVASWYGDDFHGKKTANGDTYDQYSLTAAHKTLPLPSMVRVTNEENDKTIILMVNDRGPFVKDRVIDVSRRAAEILGFADSGIANVRVQFLPGQTKRLLSSMPQPIHNSQSAKQTLVGTFDPAASQNATEQYRFDHNPNADIINQMKSEQHNQPIDMAQHLDLAIPTLNIDDTTLPASVVAAEAAKNAAPSNITAKTTSTPATSPTTSTFGNYASKTFSSFIQAGTFSMEENANKVKEQLQHLGNVLISQVPTSGKTLYRVQLGPLAPQMDNDSLLQKVISLGYSDAMIVRK